MGGPALRELSHEVGDRPSQRPSCLSHQDAPGPAGPGTTPYPSLDPRSWHTQGTLLPPFFFSFLSPLLPQAFAGTDAMQGPEDTELKRYCSQNPTVFALLVPGVW